MEGGLNMAGHWEDMLQVVLPACTHAMSTPSVIWRAHKRVADTSATALRAHAQAQLTSDNLHAGQGWKAGTRVGGQSMRSQRLPACHTDHVPAWG